MTTIKSEYNLDDTDAFSFSFRRSDEGFFQFCFKTKDGVEVAVPLPPETHAGFRAALVDIASEGDGACMEMPLVIKVPGSMCADLVAEFDRALVVH